MKTRRIIRGFARDRKIARADPSPKIRFGPGLPVRGPPPRLVHREITDRARTLAGGEFFLKHKFDEGVRVPLSRVRLAEILA